MKHSQKLKKQKEKWKEDKERNLISKETSVVTFSYKSCYSKAVLLLRKKATKNKRETEKNINHFCTKTYTSK
jgi:hypothetical protein